MELRVAESAYFITLTYSPENVPLVIQYGIQKVMSLDKRHITLFLKSLRQYILKDKKEDSRWLKQSEITEKWSSKIRYFISGEYSPGPQRPHYHLILYNLPNDYVKYDPIHRKQYSNILEQIWKHGQIDIGNVERGSAHYMTKYHMFPLIGKWSESDKREKPFATMSRKPGIGNNYIDGNTENYFNRNSNTYATLKNGIKQPLRS